MFGEHVGKLRLCFTLIEIGYGEEQNESVNYIYEWMDGDDDGYGVYN